METIHPPMGSPEVCTLVSDSILNKLGVPLPAVPGPKELLRRSPLPPTALRRPHESRYLVDVCARPKRPHAPGTLPTATGALAL